MIQYKASLLNRLFWCHALPALHLPLGPLPRSKLVFKQVVFVFQVGIRVDVSSVAT